MCEVVIVCDMSEGESSSETSGQTSLDPDEAFTLLGNETRVQILQELGTSDGTLTFTELRDSVGIKQGSQFNYHLDKLVGHFVAKTEEGYRLREPGRRVVQAILSGAVTENPRRDRTEIGFTCLRCDSPVEVRYARGKVKISCAVCDGMIDPDEYDSPRVARPPEETANVANLTLPPAGVLDRPADEMFRAAGTLTHLDALAATADVCPKCTARVEQSIASACLEHDASTGICEACNHRQAVRVHFECTNCIFERDMPALMALLDAPEIMRFAADHGLDTTGRGIEWGWEYDETILGTDPYEFEFTFRLDDEELTVRVDETFTVTSASR